MRESVRARALEWLGRHRAIVQIAVDSVCWALALIFGTVVRYDFSLASVDVGGLVAIVPLAVMAQVVAGLVSGLYTGRSRFGSFDEVAALARTVAITAAILFFLDLWVSRPLHMVPLSSVLGGGAAALVLMSGVRYVWRLSLESQRRPSGEGLQRLLIFGAGEAGAQIVTAMLRDPASEYLPVALLDDDISLRNLQVMGIPVVGTRKDLGTAARYHDADAVLLAIPSADAQVVAELTDLSNHAGVAVKVLPPVSELIGSRAQVADIRRLSAKDLLGRHQITIDLDAIASYLAGRKVLVTGAGGSIGGELCRQIQRFAPSELILLDRDESALHAAQLALTGVSDLGSPSLVLLDLRDHDLVAKLFAERRPEVVFHAAALKHVPLLERYPREAFRSNVLGTLTVLEAAAAAGVRRLVNISTDKAADPRSVLGYTKRIGERLTAGYAQQTKNIYVSVRFGNVLGSRGSVIDTFRAQIAAGGPITVTDRDATRYFMTIDEAVQLVVQAGAIGAAGEVLVLDMGDPVSIADLAARLAGMSDHPSNIIYTGLRPGEKVHEQLFGTNERGERRVHPLVSHVQVEPLSAARALEIDAEAEPTEMTAALVGLAGLGASDQDRDLRPAGGAA